MRKLTVFLVLFFATFIGVIDIPNSYEENRLTPTFIDENPTGIATIPQTVLATLNEFFENPSQDKVTLCHHSDKKPKTIVVTAQAVPAHLRHGDTLGECGKEPTIGVKSLSLEKGSYSNGELMTFIGVEDIGKKSVFVIIRGPGDEYIGMFSDPASDFDGSFLTIPRPVENFFTSAGIYSATGFTSDQNEFDGFTIHLKYNGSKVSESKN